LSLSKASRPRHGALFCDAVIDTQNKQRLLCFCATQHSAMLLPPPSVVSPTPSPSTLPPLPPAVTPSPEIGVPLPRLILQSRNPLLQQRQFDGLFTVSFDTYTCPSDSCSDCLVGSSSHYSVHRSLYDANPIGQLEAKLCVSVHQLHNKLLA